MLTFLDITFCVGRGEKLTRQAIYKKKKKNRERGRRKLISNTPISSPLTVLNLTNYSTFKFRNHAL